MRTRSEIDRLAAAGGPLLANAESLVDASEADRILARILASGRTSARTRSTLRLRPALLPAGAALAAAVAVAATGVLGSSTPRTRHRHVALNGAKLQLADYHFRTPAGFEPSRTECGSVRRTGQSAVFNGFAAAASADGGCVGAFILISSRGSAIPPGASPVDVGAYQGYLVSPDASGETVLYVVLPPLGGEFSWQAVVFESQGLTDDQLVAIAESGLPATPTATVG